MQCLDDYTSSSKLGDVGLHVRLEAVRSASLAVERALLHDAPRDLMIARICALGVESSDKMRTTVAAIIRSHWQSFGLASINESAFFTLARIIHYTKLTENQCGEKTSNLPLGLLPLLPRTQRHPSPRTRHSPRLGHVGQFKVRKYRMPCRPWRHSGIPARTLSGIK